MSAISIRDATRNDAAHLAILDNVAGHGISLWFWQGAVMMGKAEDAYEWGQERLADNSALYGWRNARIAEWDGYVAGAANSYLMPAPDPDDEKTNPEPFVPVFELFSLAVGNWFLDSIAVYSFTRKKGIGKALMDDFFDRARRSEAVNASLVAEDSNEAALSLYRSYGFSEQDQRPFIPFNKNSKTKNWLLLTAPVQQEA